MEGGSEEGARAVYRKPGDYESRKTINYDDDQSQLSEDERKEKEMEI